MRTNEKYTVRSILDKNFSGGGAPEKIQATITSANASSATAVVVGVAGKKTYIRQIIISSGAALTVQFQDDDDTPTVLIEQLYMAANTTEVITFPAECPLTVDTAMDLDVITSGAGNISVTVVGYQEA